MSEILIPTRIAVAIVYEAERAVKLVVIDSKRRSGNEILSATEIPPSNHKEKSNFIFGSQTATANTAMLITIVVTM